MNVDKPGWVAGDNDALHIWRADLRQSGSILANLATLLSVSESLKAGAFRFERDRRRFIVRRATLRLILGHYLRQSPASLRFASNSYGKPFLGGIHTHNIRFNVSYSSELALIGVSFDREVGIDIEYLAGDVDTDEVARCFSPCEQESINALPPAQRRLAFFACWTQKEAYVKARGAGLSICLDSFDVSISPSKRFGLTRASAPDDPARWRLDAFVPAPGYVAAFAIENEPSSSRIVHLVPCSLDAQLKLQAHTEVLEPLNLLTADSTFSASAPQTFA